jgi:hypothetical protein
MALFGWQGHAHDRLGNQRGSVSCHACFRVLGLWLFKSKSVNEAGEEVEGAPVSCLNTVNEHREYCPWRNPTSQNGLSSSKTSTYGKAGWEIVLQILKNDHHLRHAGDRPKPKLPSADENFDENGEFIEEDENEDAGSMREEDDKRRWARLRRVKSLFEIKPGKKFKRTSVIEGKSTSGI